MTHASLTRRAPRTRRRGRFEDKRVYRGRTVESRPVRGAVRTTGPTIRVGGSVAASS